MSIEKTKLNYLRKGKIEEEQVMVETLLSVPDLQKLLWVEAQANLEAITPTQGEVGFSGQTYIFGAYLDADKKIKPYENTAPFMGKIGNDKIDAGTSVNLVVSTRAVNFVEKSGKIECLIGITGDYVQPNQMEILCGGSESVCVKTEEITTQELLKAESLVFNEEISYPINDKMENILRVTSKVCLKSIIPEDNLFSVSGEIYTTIKYITTNEDLETVSCVSFSEPFKREIEVSGLDANGVVKAVASVDRANYKYELDKEVNKILISVPINITYRAYQDISMPYAVDAFGMENHLAITTVSANKSVVLAQEFFEAKIDGSVQVDTNAPRIDKVIGFSDPIHTITSLESSAGKVYVEGIATFDITYLNDELEDLTTIKQEIPFKVGVATDNPLNDVVFTNSQLLDVDVVARRGREVFFDAKLKFEVCSKKDICDAVITEIEVKEALPAKNHAIEIYFGKKGDDLWQIAKELKVSPSVIESQNPDLVLPLEESENIVIYNTKTR